LSGALADLTEEIEKTVKELPRDPEIIALYKKLADGGQLPPR